VAVHTTITSSVADRVALVIGNSAYKTAPLLNPVNDAADMEAALRKCGFTVMRKADLDRAEMHEAIRSFGNALERESIGLFFYAGHAVQSGGTNYLIPVDAQITDGYQVPYRTVELNEVLDAMQSAGNRMNVAILDCCRDNPYPQSERSNERGLKAIGSQEYEGMLIAYATSPGHTAKDGKGRNGVYTGCLLKHIATPGLPIEMMLKAVRKDVLAITDNGQRPWEQSSLTAELVFVPEGKEVSAGAPIWVTTHGTQTGYPPRFLTGFGMSPANRSMEKHEKIAYAENAARVNLSLMLTASIESQAVIDRFSSIVNSDEELVAAYKSKSVTRNGLNLDGVIVDHYWEKDSRPAYALAYLDRISAREHYDAKLKNKMNLLVELQGAAHRQQEKEGVSTAGDLQLKCYRVVNEIEEIIVIQDLLGGATPLTQAELKRIVGIKAESRKLWNSSADTLNDAADQLATKLALQVPNEGKIQVNALMLEDSYQYSQFSGRFRTILERAIIARTALSPITADELDFTPSSSRIARHGVAANGADYLLAGTYFVKEDGVHIYLRLSDTKTSTIVATASARALNIAVKDIEFKPRDYLQALQDRNVFRKDDIVGSSLRLESWTNRGVDGLVIEDGDEIRLYARVNLPCYLRVIQHLPSGARALPDKLWDNYYMGAHLVNKVVELPSTLVCRPPFGEHVLQTFASTAKLPEVSTVRVKTGPSETVYSLLQDAPNTGPDNGLSRGLLRNKTLELVETRISITVVPAE